MKVSCIAKCTHSCNHTSACNYFAIQNSISHFFKGCHHQDEREKGIIELKAGIFCQPNCKRPFFAMAKKRKGDNHQLGSLNSAVHSLPSTIAFPSCLPPSPPQRRGFYRLIGRRFHPLRPFSFFLNVQSVQVIKYLATVATLLRNEMLGFTKPHVPIITKQGVCPKHLLKETKMSFRLSKNCINQENDDVLPFCEAISLAFGGISNEVVPS